MGIIKKFHGLNTVEDTNLTEEIFPCFVPSLPVILKALFSGFWCQLWAYIMSDVKPGLSPCKVDALSPVYLFRTLSAYKKHVMFHIFTSCIFLLFSSHGSCYQEIQHRSCKEAHCLVSKYSKYRY